jgi:hypothetical protein
MNITSSSVNKKIQDFVRDKIHLFCCLLFSFCCYCITLIKYIGKSQVIDIRVCNRTINSVFFELIILRKTAQNSSKELLHSVFKIVKVIQVLTHFRAEIVQ